MKKIYSFLLSTLTAVTMNAQVINGDMNHNTVLDVNDVTTLIDGYLTGQTEVVGPEVNHYYVDYNMLAGTWYKSKTNSFTLNSDGTTDYGKGYTYKFLPSQGCILFYNSAGRPVTCLLVVFYPADKNYIVVKAADSNDVRTYYNQPIQPVESITLSQTSLSMKVDDYVRLTATVLPTDADNTKVEWSSSADSVVTVTNGHVVAMSEGTAIITVSALDGFGAEATCTVTVGGTPVQEGMENGHALVDLGLSVKWATTNVGATTPEGYGDYFAWGETKPKTDYSWSTYKWCNGTEKTLTKYNTSSEYSYSAPDNKTTLDLADDAANANWLGKWRMPTYDEMDELKTRCTWTWTTLNSVSGYKVTGPSGNSIFLPAAGYYIGTSLKSNGTNGYIWSNKINVNDPSNGERIMYYNSKCEWNTGYDRCGGQSVRAVCP